MSCAVRGLGCSLPCPLARACAGCRPGPVGLRRRGAGRQRRPRPGRRRRGARARRLPVADARRRRAQQRDRDRRLHGAAHRRDVRGRGVARRPRRRRLRRPRARRLRLRDLHQEVQGVPRRRREPGDAHRRQLGVVPAVGEGVGRRRPLVPLRRRRRRRAEQGVRRPARDRQGPAARQPTTAGWSASTAPSVAGSARSRAPSRTTGAPSPRSSSARTTTTTPATGWSRSTPATSARTRSAPGSNYPVDYDFGYTWFHEAEWEAGNRRSVCWAKTDQ